MPITVLIIQKAIPMNQNNPNIYEIYKENSIKTRLMIGIDTMLSGIFYLIVNDIATTTVIFISCLLVIKSINIIEGIIMPNGEIR